MLLAVFVANGAAGLILLSLVDDYEDGPSIESVSIQDDLQLLPLQKTTQELPQSTFQLSFVSMRKAYVPVSHAQPSFPLSTRD
ncbi:MAG TPA: hypothetical protein VKI62_08845 [Bacteroidota bacterium]|nr:hypothetical protein [Bacteroidota bacterium]